MYVCDGLFQFPWAICDGPAMLLRMDSLKTTTNHDSISVWGWFAIRLSTVENQSSEEGIAKHESNWSKSAFSKTV